MSQCFDSCHYCAPTAYTLPVALANLTGEHVPDTKLMMAGAVITILPVMIVFIALQKYFENSTDVREANTNSPQLPLYF